MKNKRRKFNIENKGKEIFINMPLNQRKTEYIPTLIGTPTIQGETRCILTLVAASVVQRETEYIPSTSIGYEKHEISYSDTRIIASYLIQIIQELGIQERCTNHNDTWENTKYLFFKEAVKSEDNSLFWESVENFSKIIKDFLK